MNQFEYKKRYDPDLGMYVKKHVHSGEIQGGALTDIFKSVASNLFGKTMKEAAKTAPKKAVETAALETSKHIGKKAGDKIIQLLSKKNNTTSSPAMTQMTKTKPLSQYEINERVDRIISGGKLRKIM